MDSLLFEKTYEISIITKGFSKDFHENNRIFSNHIRDFQGVSCSSLITAQHRTEVMNIWILTLINRIQPKFFRRFDFPKV